MEKVVHKIITESDLFELTKESKITALLLGADWNQGTRTMEETLDNVVQNHEDYTVGYSNLEDSQELALKYGIKVFPTILFFSQKGDLVNSISGVLSEKGMESRFSEALMNVGVSK